LSFTLELAIVPRLGLEVSPALIAFTEMLMLPYQAMQSVVEDELSANPALERLDPGECPICRGVWRTRCPVCAVPADRGAGAGGRCGGAEPTVAEPDTEVLRRAVRLETAFADAAVVDHVIDSLDEHGLLDRSPARIAAEIGVPEPAVARVLAAVRQCGPPGVGATGVVECLLLQLDALGRDDELARLTRAVIADHLPALARGHFSAIARALGTSRAQVQEVLELIRQRLRPYPAFDGTAPTPASYVVPDVVVRRNEEVGDGFVVELVEPALTRLRVRRGIPRRSSAEVSQARSFLGQLRDRWVTLRRVAEYTVLRQQDFLRCGAPALTPLTRAEVAAALGLHESTVSRAIADKYALLPDATIVPLADFFGTGGVDGELRRLLESADGPMSDQALADRLRSAGYPIARRTVAKHRARLGYTTVPLR